MLNNMHSNKKLQLVMGLVMGIVFGFLLQKGGVTDYGIIMNQLLLKDWTVIKIMLTAIIVGAVGVHLLKSFGYAALHPKPGSLGKNIIGGSFFGIGFALLGYCPGTVNGAIGQGSLDALVGGLAGILIGSALFAHAYPGLKPKMLDKGTFSKDTFPELWKVNRWVVVLPVILFLGFILWLIEHMEN
ncbi:MAG: YeeE/YedE family protein [bacterium]|nr:YeeE/YedE family protein [bacterium]